MDTIIIHMLTYRRFLSRLNSILSNPEVPYLAIKPELKCFLVGYPYVC